MLQIESKELEEKEDWKAKENRIIEVTSLVQVWEVTSYLMFNCFSKGKNFDL